MISEKRILKVLAVLVKSSSLKFKIYVLYPILSRNSWFLSWFSKFLNKLLALNQHFFQKGLLNCPQNLRMTRINFIRLKPIQPSQLYINLSLSLYKDTIRHNHIWTRLHHYQLSITFHNHEHLHCTLNTTASSDVTSPHSHPLRNSGISAHINFY